MWWWFFHGFPHSPMEFNRDVYRAEPLCSEVGLYMHGSTIFLNHRPNDLAPCLQWTDRTSKSSGWNHHEMTMKWTRNGGHTSISHGHMENDRKVEIRYQNRTGYVCTVYIYIYVYIYIASISLCDSWSFPLKNRQDLMALVAQDLIAIMDEAKRPIDNSTKERFGWWPGRGSDGGQPR